MTGDGERCAKNISSLSLSTADFRLKKNTDGGRVTPKKLEEQGKENTGLCCFAFFSPYPFSDTAVRGGFADSELAAAAAEHLRDPPPLPLTPVLPSGLFLSPRLSLRQID